MSLGFATSKKAQNIIEHFLNSVILLIALWNECHLLWTSILYSNLPRAATCNENVSSATDCLTVFSA